MVKKNISTILIIFLALALIVLVIALTDQKIKRLEQGGDSHGNVHR